MSLAAPSMHIPYGMRTRTFEGLNRKGVYGKSWKTFSKNLVEEIKKHNVTNGAAALAYFLLLAIFPATIFLLSLLPYLPISNLNQEIMGLLRQLLPGEAADMFSGAVQEIASNRKGGLLSIGALATLWAASSGMYAIMQQLNITYDVKEGRSFFKVRTTALLLTIGFGGLIIGAFALIVLGGQLEGWVASHITSIVFILGAFAILKWAVIVAALSFAFAIIYYFGPDVEQDFRFITPGSIFGVVSLIVASLCFKLYVDHFGQYSATYGSIGAVIIMMLWLNITGLVLLLGSEINSLIEHYSPDGKAKGEKTEPVHAA